jgi:antitoxin component of MazEF toxin-antitoxin module
VCAFNSVRRDGNGLGVLMPIAVLEEIHTLHIRLAVKGSVWDWISEQPQIFYYVANNLNKQSEVVQP